MTDPPVVASAYVEVLDGQRAALVEALRAELTPDDIAAAQRDSARLSVRLDASPLTAATADAVDRGDLPSSATRPSASGNGHAGGWATALRLDGLPTQDIAALEYRGVRAAQAAEPELAARFLAAPADTVAQIHRLVAADLVAPDRLGALRRTTRAVHDGAQGQVIFQSPSADRLADLLDGLEAWVRGPGHTQLPLALAGVVHNRLLHWRPFEAGNGRVARLASRVALRASGGDPWGVAVPERAFDDDPLGYARQVAATIRRGVDLRPWNEWTGEAVVASLELVARARGLEPPDVDARAVRACAPLAEGETITVLQIGADVGLQRRAALVQANRLCWLGLLRRDRGTHGLRYARTATDVSIRSGRSRHE